VSVIESNREGLRDGGVPSLGEFRLLDTATALSEDCGEQDEVVELLNRGISDWGEP